MRGKPRFFQRVRADSRITPADAGKTYMRQQNTTITKDHPRGCGENLKDEYIITLQLGSPPRMRGKLNDMKKENLALRITPADAGKTDSEIGTVPAH